jgi:GNAT superfamily N-acetyltransferase
MIIFSSYRNNQVIVMTENRSVAELSCVIQLELKGIDPPIFYFHRIKVLPEFEGTGEGRELMIEICRYMDHLNATIYNELNPYGKRDMEGLKSFFRASGFEDYESVNNHVMIRRPQNG